MEQHSGLRFAWLRKQAEESASDEKPASQLVFLLYNLVWWFPIVLPFVTEAVSYRAGFIAFGVVTLVRAVINFYRVNMLPLDRGEQFPLRSA